MTEISAALVKELRDRTGAGMMDCKRALQETNGDMDAAVVLLREKGMASAQKRAGPRDDRRARRLPPRGRRQEGNDGRGRLRDRARLEERRVPGVREEGARDRRRRAASTRSRSSTTERTELSAKLGENIAVAGAARFEAVERRDRRPRTRIRRRTSSACCCSFAAATRISAGRSRCTSPRRTRSGSAATTCRRTRSRRSARSTRTPTRCSRSPSRRARRSSRACSTSASSARTCSPTRSGSTTPSKTVGQALKEAGAEVLEFERFALA